MQKLLTVIMFISVLPIYILRFIEPQLTNIEFTIDYWWLILGCLTVTVFSAVAMRLTYNKNNKYPETPYMAGQDLASKRLAHCKLPHDFCAMEAYKRVAFAFNHSILDLAAAIIDGSHYNFEAIKFFGIKAKLDGDYINISFMGEAVKSPKEPDSIAKYIRLLGETKLNYYYNH